MGFQRARSDEQRAQRRASILAAASGMLAQVPVAEVSLNELSRRVGLAKSNVLRYFHSREAILLELLDAELAEWATALDDALAASDAALTERIAVVADGFAESLAARPIMCDLVSAQSSVLERNISMEVALAHKRTIAVEVERVIGAIVRTLPEVDVDQAYRLVAYVLLHTAGAWPQSQPAPALQAAYDADPAAAATQLDFADTVRDLLTLLVRGMLAGR